MTSCSLAYIGLKKRLNAGVRIMQQCHASPVRCASCSAEVAMCISMLYSGLRVETGRVSSAEATIRNECVHQTKT